jgi:hypothetical protein
VRHVRMLGLCIVAVLALAAVSASSALALKNPTKSIKIFDKCPVTGLDNVDCVFGATEPGEGGQFTVGPITVPLAKQITLQYGLEVTEGPHYEEVLTYLPPTHGAEAINPTPERVPAEPLNNITQAEQEELGWPEGLQYSYAQAKKHHKTKKVFETIEQAGSKIETSIFNIILQEGVGVEVGVKIKGENAWMAQLGDVCYIGSEAEPIEQHLTSGASESPLTHETIEGTPGELGFDSTGEEVWLTKSDLVDNTYPVPGASCSGPYSSYLAATIDKEFGIPAAAGASVTELKGTLYTAASTLAEAGGA